jgi:hypothetical protein
MLYHIGTEPIQQHVAATAHLLTGKAPSTFKESPELRWGLQLYFDAFFDLDSERSHGVGYTRIPWHCIVAYALYHQFNDDQTDRLLIHLRAMDSAFIKKLSDDADARRT